MPNRLRTVTRVAVLSVIVALLVPAGIALAQEDTVYPPPDEGVMPGEVLQREDPGPVDDVAPSEVRQEVLSEELAATGSDLLLPLVAAGLLLILLGSGAVIAIGRRRGRGDEPATS